MDITFKFQKTPPNQWLIEWSRSDNSSVPLETGFSSYSSRTKARNKEAKLIAPLLHSKDSFEVTYHIP